MFLQLHHLLGDGLLSACHGALGQTAEERKKLLVEHGQVLLDDLAAHVGRAGLKQTLHQHDAVLLGLDHLGRDAVLAEDGLDHRLEGQVGLRTQQVALALFGGQAVHHLLDERTEDLLLLIDGYAHLGREEGQQQFFVIVVIDDGSGQAAFVSAVRTTRHVRAAVEQALFGLRVLGHVEELFDIGGDGLAAARAGNLSLGHEKVRFSI